MQRIASLGYSSWAPTATRETSIQNYLNPIHSFSGATATPTADHKMMTGIRTCAILQTYSYSLMQVTNKIESSLTS